MLNILYFGHLSDRVGRREELLDLPQGIILVSGLKNWLDSAHDLGGALLDPSVKTMVDQVLVHEDTGINGDEEIGFLPPVGGG